MIVMNSRFMENALAEDQPADQDPATE